MKETFAKKLRNFRKSSHRVVCSLVLSSRRIQISLSIESNELKNALSQGFNRLPQLDSQTAFHFFLPFPSLHTLESSPKCPRKLHVNLGLIQMVKIHQVSLPSLILCPNSLSDTTDLCFTSSTRCSSSRQTRQEPSIACTWKEGCFKGGHDDAR